MRRQGRMTRAGGVEGNDDAFPAAEAISISVPAALYRRLEALARAETRTVSELVRRAVEIQFGDSAIEARNRLIDRLARLEARLSAGDSVQDGRDLPDDEDLEDQIRIEARRVHPRSFERRP